jgi:hypothetical protein
MSRVSTRHYAALVLRGEQLALPPRGHAFLGEDHVQDLRVATKDDRYVSALVALHGAIGPLVNQHYAHWLAHPADPGTWSRWDFVGDACSYDALKALWLLPIVEVVLPSPFAPDGAGRLTADHLAALPHLAAKGLAVGATMHEAAAMLAEHHGHMMYHPQS